MDEFSMSVHEMLMHAYRAIHKTEEIMVHRMASVNLSISELHTLEAVGDAPEGVTLTQVAQDMEISAPSATVAVKKLARKGYVEKVRAGDDGRCVHVHLTQAGRRVYVAHRYFHSRLVRSITRSVSDEERDAFMRAMAGLNEYLDSQIEYLEHTDRGQQL